MEPGHVRGLSQCYAELTACGRTLSSSPASSNVCTKGWPLSFSVHVQLCELLYVRIGGARCGGSLACTRQAQSKLQGARLHTHTGTAVTAHLKGPKARCSSTHTLHNAAPTELALEVCRAMTPRTPLL